MENGFLIEMRSITKQFPGVLALQDVDLMVKKQEIHGVVGENGAGKSSLMKVLSGIYIKDSGEIRLDGKLVELKDAQDAHKHGINLVHQEPQIVSTLPIYENIGLGNFPHKGIFMDKKKLIRKSSELCRYVGIDKPVEMLTEYLSIGERQLLQFARAIFYESSIIVMDEPTSSLAEKEKDHMFSIVRKLRDSGVTFVYITHRMDELFEICDKITVLKDGKLVRSVDIKEIDKKGLVNLMVGREVGHSYPEPKEQYGDEVLRVENLNKKGVYSDVSMYARAGEVVGFGGLVGAGRTEVMDAIFGMAPPESGDIYIHGKKTKIHNPKEAIESQIAYVTEDRHGGLMLHASIIENMTIASLKEFVDKFFINEKKKIQKAEDYKKRINIKAPDLQTAVGDLSGGNQQKVIFAKWLLGSADIYILDEPTRGIDVGAKDEIYKIIRTLTDTGKAVIVISSDMPELLGISDRIYVMHNGRITGELLRKDATESKVLQYATGVMN